MQPEAHEETGIHLVAPSPALRDSVLDTLSGFGPPAAHGDVGGFLQLLADAPEDSRGAVLLAPDVPPSQVLALLLALADRGHGWVCLYLEEREGAWSALPLDAGFRLPAAQAVERVVSPDAEAPLLELRTVLRLVGRARHDINNPLTAAMAEIQFLIMDAQDEELRESAELVNEQLKRIRDMVADLRTLKPTRTS